jgi:hypothetical protein
MSTGGNRHCGIDEIKNNVARKRQGRIVLADRRDGQTLKWSSM